MFWVKPLRSPCGHLLKVSVTCTNKHKRCCYLPFSLSLVLTSCTMSMVGIATHFLGISTVCKFAYVIQCFLSWNLVLFRNNGVATLVTILLRSEIPSGMCAKLRTVAASNNRHHPTRSLSSLPLAGTINCSTGSQVLFEVTKITPSGSLYYCLFAPHTYIFVLRTHPVRGESHNQRNTTGEVATIPQFCHNAWRCWRNTPNVTI